MSEPLGDLATITATTNPTYVVVTDQTTSNKILVSDFKKLIIPYGVYKAQITQVANENPVAVVLENTLSADITWTKTSDGVFNGNLTGAFPDAAKLFFIPVSVLGLPDISLEVSRIDSNNIKLDTKVAGVHANSELTNYPFEIQVYP